MHIVGTAGHVDHGKSSLVISLTGHDPDRFAEERRRGMTLDLGFAPLRFSDGIEAGIVDVPGHERFLHNMLAGAAGMELLLLVVSAVEGPRQQTREHLRILNFLNVQRCIAVLTMKDLVGPEELEIAAGLVADECAGTIAQGAPLIAVSNATGDGIAQLKIAIHDALAALPARRPDAPAYLPVDRVFALPGHGTIVTGTLMQGTIAVGDALAFQPSGIAARVKSLQVFGRNVDRATGGARVAVNVPGVGVDAIARGETLVAPREFEPLRELDLEFTPLPEALLLLRRRLFVRAYIGSAEILGRLVLHDLDGAHARGATLFLNRPAVAFAGTRLVLRRMSPKDLLGGAVVRGAAARTEPADEAMSADARAVLAVLDASGLTPLSIDRLAGRANIRAEAAAAAVAELLAAGQAAELHRPSEYVSRAALDGAFARAADHMRAHQERKPWSAGLTAGDVAKALGIAEPLAARLLAVWLEDGRAVQRGKFYSTPEHAPHPSAAQQRYFASALPAQDAPAPAPFGEVAAGAARVDGGAEALEAMLLTGALVRVGDDLYTRAQMIRARDALVSLLQREGRATMAQIRDLFATSRKHALPLMEHFDAVGLTLRDGDYRRLRKQAGAGPLKG